MDPEEFYANWSDTAWKFDPRGMIPCRSLFRGP
jgi:hypothetical protein